MAPAMKGVRSLLALDVGYARIGLARTMVNQLNNQSIYLPKFEEINNQADSLAINQAVKQIIRMKPVRLTMPHQPIHQRTIVSHDQSTTSTLKRSNKQPNKLSNQPVNQPPTLSSVVQELQSISSRYQIDQLIVGMPARKSVNQPNLTDDAQCATIVRTINAIKAHWEQSVRLSLNQSNNQSTNQPILRMPPIIYVDETMSTVQAKQRLYAKMKQSNNHASNQTINQSVNWLPTQVSGEIDSEAAAIVLERYLTDSNFADRFEID